METCKKAYDTWLKDDQISADEIVFSNNYPFHRRAQAYAYYAGYHAQDELIKELVGALLAIDLRIKDHRAWTGQSYRQDPIVPSYAEKLANISSEALEKAKEAGYTP